MSLFHFYYGKLLLFIIFIHFHYGQQTTPSTEYFERFRRSVGFSVTEIDLPDNCQIIQPVETDIVIKFVWSQIDKEIQVLNTFNNLFIRVVDNGSGQIKVKWQQSALKSELLSNLLRNVDNGLLQNM